MSPSENMVHVRLDPANMKTAKRLAKKMFRENMTALINSLVEEAGKKNPAPKKR